MRALNKVVLCCTDIERPEEACSERPQCGFEWFQGQVDWNGSAIHGIVLYKKFV